MTQPAGAEAVVRLPFQVRPQSGEGARSFILRLARANCLPPAYLRKYLARPPYYRGGPDWDRIGAVTGRDPVELRQVLETIECLECGQPMRPMSSFGVRPQTCSKACRQKRYRKGIPASDWKKVPCRVCGNLIRHRVGQRRYMCSSHCRRVAFQFRRRGEPLPWPQKGDAGSEPAEDDELDGICPVCECPMTGVTGRTACSRRCSARIAHWTRSPLPPATACCHCRGPVLPRADGQPRDWCSLDCRNQEIRRLRSPGEGVVPPHAAEAGPAGPEGPSPFRAMTCRGCGRRYRPRAANPWCSRHCLGEEVQKRADKQECAGCGASMANRRPVTGRIWCSDPCRQRATRWHAEFRAREGRPAPQAPSLSTCRGCRRTYQPLRPNPWCSNRCFEQEIIERSDQRECAACGASTAHLKPTPNTRKWCSGTCQQRSVRWRAELRDRAAHATVGPTSLA